ncbi:MAG: 50S ribosomal protein L9 [Mycoplasma sp.]|nr:50S ribosomal protein L9 [Mycoplasma sp.]MDD7149844.1 50S ribosomal protein L9 [Mycoplasma sp.]MDY4544393.1 50S ribosomal protein L9 [Bacilli bacterium]MDY4618601.1 50S ribosomal protein L9 [Bacilli bacterium]
MKVILLKDVKSQGRKDDIINVSDGYANNYLIKNKLAVAYTETSKKILDKQIQIRNDEEAKIVANLTEIKNKLNDKIIEFKVKTGKDDRVFGTVSSKQISDKINELGYDIDKKCILIDTPLSSLGTYKVKIKLHKKVEFNINIKLIK